MLGQFIGRIISRWKQKRYEEEEATGMNKYLIVGLGNPGSEYEGTRHNAGYIVLDAMAREAGASWTTERHAFRTEIHHRGRTLILIKPTTFMNLSGKAVRYWMQAERVGIEQVLVVVDDIALPPGEIRMKKQGSGGGHNGLADIEAVLGSQAYCRLRIGVGNNFSRGRQVDYVLGRFLPEELPLIEEAVQRSAEAVRLFATEGADRAMNRFNTGKGKHQKEKNTDPTTQKE